MASSPAFTDQSETDPNVKCEFAKVCQMGADGEQAHYRKTICHIFGRNKSATKVFSQEVQTKRSRKWQFGFQSRKQPYDAMLDSYRAIAAQGGVWGTSSYWPSQNEYFHATLERNPGMEPLDICLDV